MLLETVAPAVGVDHRTLALLARAAVAVLHPEHARVAAPVEVPEHAAVVDLARGRLVAARQFIYAYGILLTNIPA